MAEPLHPIIRQYYEAYNARRFQQGADLCRMAGCRN
jgi:hypothetical protein